VLESLATSLEGRFVASRWNGDHPSTPRASTLDEVRGTARPTLFLVEEGERLGAEGARVLRALAHDPGAERCVAVALEADEAGAVLGGLGPELEIVVLREAGGAKRPLGALRLAALGGALGVAGVSFGIALALLLPRFAPERAVPGPAPTSVAEAAPPPALPPVAAAPPAAAGPEAAAPLREKPAPRRAAPAASAHGSGVPAPSQPRRYLPRAFSSSTRSRAPGSPSTAPSSARRPSSGIPSRAAGTA
jgi:hypothetical protein